MSGSPWGSHPRSTTISRRSTCGCWSRSALIEKCFALHHLASTWTEEDPPTEARFGRHDYDVYKLLGNQPTLHRLADRDGFDAVVEDVARVSRNHFGPVTPRPKEGFGASRAFQPEPGFPLRSWLQIGDERSLTLCRARPARRHSARSSRGLRSTPSCCSRDRPRDLVQDLLTIPIISIVTFYAQIVIAFFVPAVKTISIVLVAVVTITPDSQSPGEDRRPCPAG